MFSVLYISELCCCSFLQSTHFFDNWKKQKIILRKSEKEIFLKERDQNSGTGTQPPTTPQRSTVRQLSTNKSSGRGPCSRFQQHSGIKKPRIFCTGREGRLPHFICIIPFSKTSTVQCQETTSLNRKVKSQVSSQAQSFYLNFMTKERNLLFKLLNYINDYCLILKISLLNLFFQPIES